MSDLLKKLLIFYFFAIVRRASAAFRGWQGVLLYLLIIMIAAGDLTLKLVDTLDGHPDPLFLSGVDRVEEWFSVHSGILCANGVEALRAKLPELRGQPVGHEIKVLYTPEASRHRYRQPGDGLSLQSNL